MQTLTETLDHTDLKAGRIYNREYTGENEAYKKSNGKTTFEVISVGEKLVIRELYSFSGYAIDKQHKSNRITFSVPEAICKEYIIYECSDPEKWFIHKKAMTLQEAIESKAIIVKDLEKIFCDQSKDSEKKDHVTYYENGKRYLEMLAKPTEKYPYLSMVIFLFENTEDLKSQVTKFVPKAWFMF